MVLSKWFHRSAGCGFSLWRQRGSSPSMSNNMWVIIIHCWLKFGYWFFCGSEIFIIQFVCHRIRSSRVIGHRSFKKASMCIGSYCYHNIAIHSIAIYLSLLLQPYNITIDNTMIIRDGYIIWSFRSELAHKTKIQRDVGWDFVLFGITTPGNEASKW